MEIRRGIAVSEGVAIGPALVLDTEGVRIPARFVPPDRHDAEVARLHAALAAGVAAARRIHQSLVASVGDDIADIFDAHEGMYQDPKLLAHIEALVRAHHYSAEYAVSRHIRTVLKQIDAKGGAAAARLRADFLDVEKQLIAELVGGDRREPLSAVAEPVVVLANDLTPSETAQFDPKMVHAIATESGGATSHTAILAGALEIPAVVGVGRFLTDVSGGDTVIVDGTQGLLILDPDDATLRKYEVLRRSLRASQVVLANWNIPAVTRDGVKVHLLGNIEFPSEAKPALERGAEGVGLYRTEFLYVNKDHDPTEDEQFEAYRAVLTEVGPDRPVVIRTLDLGGDKFVPATTLAVAEKNPFLGLRSVRLCLRNLPLFKTQLRAILRASVYGDARIMFPMVSTVMELRQCRSILREVQEDLEETGIPYKADLPVGTMIEVPSAALMADVLAKQVNFFSVGTNDLVQYTLAADRNNETVADLYDAADPAVLRLLAMVVKAATPGKVEVTVCGEMSGEPMYTALLLGLGLRSFSATPRKIPELKRTVRALAVPDCEKLAGEALRLETAREVNAYLSAHLRRALPDAEV